MTSLHFPLHLRVLANTQRLNISNHLYRSVNNGMFSSGFFTFKATAAGGRGGGVCIKDQKEGMLSLAISAGSHSCMSGTCKCSCAMCHSKNAWSCGSFEIGICSGNWKFRSNCLPKQTFARYLLRLGRLRRVHCSMQGSEQRTMPIESLQPRGGRSMIHQRFWVPYDLQMVGAWEADGV